MPYWVASCLRAGGAMVGATVFTSCSNSARVTTVLQSAAFEADGLSHNPAIVITGVPGATVVPSAALVAGAAAAVAALGGAGRAAGLSAWPQAAVTRIDSHNQFR